MHNSGADGTRGTNQRRHLKLCLPMGTMAANWKKRRLRYVRSQNAQKNYERYLALARDEAQIGNTVGAENYYQYAEHYFRSMRSDSEGT